MYRKSLRRKLYERKVAKCAVMRAAKERKRLAEAEALRDVGGLVTDGVLGVHTVRLLAYPGEARAVAITVDGTHRRPRSLAGVKRVLADMLFGRMKG